MHFNNQKTLGSKINLSGIGLHSGNIVDLVIKPAPEQFWNKVFVELILIRTII